MTTTSSTSMRLDRLPDGGSRRIDRLRPLRRADARVAGAAWVALVAAAVVVGISVADADVNLGAAPLVGRWDLRLHPGLLVAGLLGGGIVVTGPRLAAKLRWRSLLTVVALASSAFATALATTDGWGRLTAAVTTRFEYEPHAATIGSATDFWRGFVDAVPDLPTHVKAHPPGAALVPWVLDRAGLGGAGWWAALVIAAWGVAAVAVLHAARSVLGEARARQAAPLLVVLPGAVWAATSADALFAAVLATGVAIAVAGKGDRRSALAGGAVLGAGLLLTYGGALLLLVPAAVAWHRRRPGDFVATVAGLAAVLVVAAVAGFWWLDGLAATRVEYWDGLASVRPGGYLTLLGNPAALALATGPALAVGLARRRPDVLAGAVLVAVAVADLSQLSRGEVERIWLPFVPWLALAAAPASRRLLAAQVATAVTVQAVLWSPW
ncbi:MAG: hypothetical protein LC744_06945 [Chloroflexi bacterium]|nr:hypothetical protein [Chloroflexota bacterium]